ncbi:MAG: hypothetical protein M3384_10800 [Acidobacteriota bacterium]|nr:hypothetical protein [Acidobacteriota bacterium]
MELFRTHDNRGFASLKKASLAQLINLSGDSGKLDFLPVVVFFESKKNRAGARKLEAEMRAFPPLTLPFKRIFKLRRRRRLFYLRQSRWRNQRRFFQRRFVNFQLLLWEFMII